MFELFAALFGAGYIGHKISSERRAHETMESNVQKGSRIRQKLLNYPYEDSLRDTVRKYKYTNAPEKMKLLEEIDQDMKYIVGKQNYLEEFDVIKKMIYIEPSSVALGFPTLWEIAIQVLMAKHGCIWQWGYNVNCEISGYTIQESRGIVTRALRTIEKYIQATHPEIDRRYITLYYTPYNDGKNIEWGYNYIGFESALRRPW